MAQGRSVGFPYCCENTNDLCGFRRILKNVEGLKKCNTNGRLTSESGRSRRMRVVVQFVRGSVVYCSVV